MAIMEVIVNKLNRRRSPVIDFNDKSNVVDVAVRGITFESVDEIENALGKWYKDRDGYYYWGKGLKQQPDISDHGAPPRWKFDAAKMSWAHDSLANGGLGIVDLWNETGIQGERVNIAILDTGIIDHNDFKINGESIVKQIHLVDGITSIKDSAGHGTNSAAIAAATGVEIINGIAPKANLFIVKISENTGIESNGAEIAEALKFIKDSNWPVDIISIAYSFKQQNEEVKTSIAELEEQGRIVLCALNHRIQGNSLIISNDQFPAAYGNVIPIAAYSKSSSPTPLPPCEVSKRKTNWIFPGEKILTLDKDGQTTEGNFTSIATPLAAGVFAVFLSLMKKKNIAVDRTNIDKLRSLFINTGNQKTIKIGEDEVSFLLPMVLKAIKEFDKTFNQ